MSRKVRKYTKEFRQEAVALALKSPSIVSTAEALGVPVRTLHRWLKNNKTSEKGDASSHTADLASALEESRRLHKELAIAREERDILKKAAEYFAQHQK